MLRHQKANDTAYNLEPNVKTGPGGLRDIQTIGWVAKRHFGAESLDGLARRGFITASELRRLKQAQSFLWKVRFGLHIVTGRREDRLLFDHQLKLAQIFGYEDASYTLAVEQFMQRYYRTVMDASLLNELLLQLFSEAILSNEEEIRPLNARFQVRNGSLEARRDDVFARTPSALLELFVLLQQNPDIKGVRASTMRAVTRSLWLIDEEFRQNPRHHRLFMDILRAPVGVTHELRRMNNYEVLGSLHSGLRPHRRAHAVRSVPRLHRGCAHAVRAQQPAAPGDPALRPRAAGAVAHHAAAAQARDRLPRGAVP